MKVSINERLLDEILVHIFLYLTKNERLQCRAVCRRWFNLLVTASRTFKDDWSLNLSDTDVRTPSLGLILSSQVRYQALSLDVNTKISGDQRLWQKLGKTVTCVKLSGKVATEVDGSLMKVISHLKNARTLVVDDSVEVLTSIIGRTEESVFQNVDTLILNSLSVQDVTTVKKAIERLPMLSSLHLGKSIDHLTLPMLLELKTQVNHFQIESAYVDFDDWNGVHVFCLTPDKTQIMIDLLNVLNRSVKKLTFVSRKNEMQCLRKILEENPNMREVGLVCTGFPLAPAEAPGIKSVIDAKLITALDLWLDFSSYQSPTFAPLNHFRNLSTLKVTVKNSKEDRSVGCFFGHQELNFGRIRKLSYTYYHSKLCHVCQESMIRSCKRLESLKMDLNESSKPLLLLSQLPSLRKVRWRKVSSETLLTATFNDEAQCLDLPNLERIELISESNSFKKSELIDAKSMVEGLFKSMRGVKDVVLEGFTIHQGRNEFEQILFKELPRLRNLDVGLCSFQWKPFVPLSTSQMCQD